jgi:hypothetical protein
MTIPTVAKFWALILLLIFIVVGSGYAYILTRPSTPQAPTAETLDKHLQDLEIRAKGVIGQELDNLITK